jgi:hypothetical protein
VPCHFRCGSLIVGALLHEIVGGLPGDGIDLDRRHVPLQLASAMLTTPVLLPPEAHLVRLNVLQFAALGVVVVDQAEFRQFAEPFELLVDAFSTRQLQLVADDVDGVVIHDHWRVWVNNLSGDGTCPSEAAHAASNARTRERRCIRALNVPRSENHVHRSLSVLVALEVALRTHRGESGLACAAPEDEAVLKIVRFLFSEVTLADLELRALPVGTHHVARDEVMRLQPLQPLLPCSA